MFENPVEDVVEAIVDKATVEEVTVETGRDVLTKKV